jgi:hypothetical protein
VGFTVTGPNAPAVFYVLVETKATVRCCVTGEMLLNFRQISCCVFFPTKYYIALKFWQDRAPHSTTKCKVKELV